MHTTYLFVFQIYRIREGSEIQGMSRSMAFLHHRPTQNREPEIFRQSKISDIFMLKFSVKKMFRIISCQASILH